MKKRTTTSSIDDSTVYLYANLYNEIVDSVFHNPNMLQFKCDLKDTPWYKDMLSLIKLIDLLKCTPRDYIHYQVRTYKPSFYKGRKIPTVRMLASPNFARKWEEKVFKDKQYKAPIVITKEATIAFSQQRMQALMEKYHMSELAFFQDPVMISQVSPDFLRLNKTFKNLLYSGYYKSNFGLEDSYILQ